MRRIHPQCSRRPMRTALALSFALSFALPLASQKPTLPSETPAKFTPTDSGFEYARRDVMIAMRDGVKLHTVILVPRGAQRAPILMTRTPYDAKALTSYAASSH